MRPPLIVVTGAIASGKTFVAEIMAAAGGTLLDADSLAHRALEISECRAGLVRAFGANILTPSGNISKTKLGRIVFSQSRNVDRLNRLVRPHVKKIISDEIRRSQSRIGYIVLDAVLFFQYKFRFKVDLVVLTKASTRTRLRRMMQRDGLSKAEALMRIERQRPLEREWTKADLTIRTDGSKRKVAKIAAGIRDRFLRTHRHTRKDSACKKR